MTIDYISDVHFDTHLGLWSHVQREHFERNFEAVFVPIFETKSSDTLIVAGDIGEHNRQNIEALRLIREWIGYRHIVLVMGNHDWFLANRAAIDDYNERSANRVNEFKELVAKEEGLYLLDGDVVEIEGIRIGGAMSWYDGSYCFHNLNPYYTKDREYLQRVWCELNPDGDHIFGIEAFDDLLPGELAKLERVYMESDVIVTHINPSIRPEHTAKRWSQEDTTGFFTFDGSRFLVDTPAQFWIFGHTHIPLEYQRHGVQCRSNPLGYPNERWKDFRVKHIEIECPRAHSKRNWP